MILGDAQIPLKYFSCSSGNTELKVNEKIVVLSENGETWMGLDLNTKWQANEFVFELTEAHGLCVTTGLGLGILQTLLLRNPNVSKVKVYEKNQNVINIFLQIVEKNNFDISNLEIVNIDADELKNISCDCLFLDHFEHEPDAEIIQRVKNISEQNNCGLLWYWPGVKHFSKFCAASNLILNNYSFDLWKKTIGIKKLPDQFTDVQLDYINNLRSIYLDLTKNSQNFARETYKNKLRDLFGNKK